MLGRLQQFVREWRAWRAFSALPASQRRLVFYSEGSAYRVHFEAILRHLREDHRQPVTYLTSDPADPLLSEPPAGVTTYCIGDGAVRTLLFASLDVDVMVMTMPDLHTYHIKRSPHGVHYVYVHHSMVSCHMVYRPAAFDHFDAVFCVGPHHEREIRAREAAAGLPAKRLVPHGYARLEALMEELDRAASPSPRTENPKPLVLIAPSWGENALLERLGCSFVGAMLDAGYRVTLRPHPQTRRFCPEALEIAKRQYVSHPDFVLEENVASKASLLAADVMISDWSGAALEFAFAREKPVIFVDVPRKVNNPDWQSLGITPLEDWIRSEIGVVVQEQALDTIPAGVAALLAAADRYRSRIRELRQQVVYNPGRSGAVGAAELVALVNGRSDRNGNGRD